MKDRVPTQVVNGAVRMAQYNASGTFTGYIYLKRADEPSEPGTPYNKKQCADRCNCRGARAYLRQSNAQ